MRYFKKRVTLYICFWLFIGLHGCGIEETPPAFIEEKNEINSFEGVESVFEQEVYLAFTGSMNIPQFVVGSFFCTEPAEADEDYQLYFKKKDDDYPLENQYTTADMTYKFPDIREENRPIGKPIEIYYVESLELSGDEFIDLLFVAVYEVKGNYCFDTRVYIGCDTGYEVDQQMSEYLNEKYSDLGDTEYPLLNGAIDEIREIYKFYGKKYYLNLNAKEKCDWETACIEIIKHMEEYLVDPYEIRKYTDNPQSKMVYISVIDFNNDKIPELLVGDGVSACIFTYDNGELRKIIDLYHLDDTYPINGIYERNGNILLISSGSDGCGYVAFGFCEADGTYKMGVYDEYRPNEITVNGEKATLEEFNRIFDVTNRQTNIFEQIPKVRIIRNKDSCLLQFENGEEVLLDSTFDFNKILCNKLVYK